MKKGIITIFSILSVIILFFSGCSNNIKVKQIDLSKQTKSAKQLEIENIMEMHNPQKVPVYEQMEFSGQEEVLSHFIITPLQMNN